MESDIPSNMVFGQLQCKKRLTRSLILTSNATQNHSQSLLYFKMPLEPHLIVLGHLQAIVHQMTQTHCTS
jgi:hypothetical protein